MADNTSTRPSNARSQTKPFHIIIAGGGLIGLTAAHIFSSLQSALPQHSLTFTVLEAHTTLAPSIGSLLLLYPIAFRVYDQLGLLPAVQDVVDDINSNVSIRAENGETLAVDGALHEDVRRRHGHAFKVLHRPQLVDVLERGLGSKGREKVRLGKRVVDVEVEEGGGREGVKVTCADGTVVRGDMVIGADGVRSRVRSRMDKLRTRTLSWSNKTPPEEEDTEKSPYMTSYRLLFGNLPVLPDLELHMNWEGAHAGVSTQLLTGSRQSWWAVYELLDEPTARHIKYTEADKKAVFDRWQHLHVAPGYTLRDVVAHNSGLVGLIHLEEGMVECWTRDRIVLVGDAVRKLEPHAGLGFNQGVEDVVVLANKLYALLEGKKGDERPSTKELRRLFKEYETERKISMPLIDRICRRRARQVAWPSWGFEWYATWVLPYIPITKLGLKYITGPMIAKSPVLDWLEESALPEHEVPYLHHGLKKGAERGKKVTAVVSKKGATRSGVLGVGLGTATVLVAGLAAFGFRYYRRV